MVKKFENWFDPLLIHYKIISIYSNIDFLKKVEFMTN